MPSIGITGGLGTGKSSVARLFADRGALSLSADAAAREVTAPGSPALREIAEAFGPSYVLPDGRLDRAGLGALIFRDPAARRRLEEITHPRILELLRARMMEARRHAATGTVVAVEVPLLFEVGMDDWFDRTLVVAASEPVQVARLVARDGIAADEALRRIKAQMPLSEKAARADYVVSNDGALADLAASIDPIWHDLQSLGV